MDEEGYDKIISECTKEVDSEGRYMAEALLLRATFHLLTRNEVDAGVDLDRILNMQEANVKLRANALIKRGSLYNQTHERLLSRKHFNMAAEIDACNPDVYHHRGQREVRQAGDPHAIVGKALARPCPGFPPTPGDVHLNVLSGHRQEGLFCFSAAGRQRFHECPRQ
ncbi:mitochondrial import receptor subunit TOM70-like [Corythoichthys intestinalis]|uniref:mitochondrial import receptor subunit TOM70-like n=1 Tax=Corythoichthys intestinalis TaxID=161448 RepID=UPI0025A5F8FF|nr:mitochondrial import receptor subunit TOM70-like [Corythoichthys intestinalis]